MMVVIAGKAAVDRLVIAGIDLERLAPAIMGDAPVAHDEIAILENKMRKAKHFRQVLAGRIDGHIGQSAFAEMAAILEAEQLRRRGTGHDGDFVEIVFARDRRQASSWRRHLAAGARWPPRAASRLMISAKISG